MFHPENTWRIYAVGAWLALLILLAGTVRAATAPFFPTLTLGGAAAVATSSISVSIYADSEISTSPSATVFGSHGPIKEWSLSVVKTGSATGFWAVDIEVSNDDATWTRIARHATADGSGTMVWVAHRTARRARLNLSSVGAGCYVTATLFGSP